MKELEWEFNCLWYGLTYMRRISFFFDIFQILFWKDRLEIREKSEFGSGETIWGVPVVKGGQNLSPWLELG